jgi:hypothetical protein
MTIASKSVTQLSAGYVAAAKVAEALRDYNQGTNAPATQLGRYTVTEVDDLIQDAIDALVILVPQGS